jgi:hypothetical protein
MRINFHKCDLVPINVESEEARLFSQTLSCRLGKFPMNYLGAPLHYKKLRKEDLQPVIDKVIKKGGGWRGKLLSYKAKIILIKACLASIPNYPMSVIKFPKWAITLINSLIHPKCIYFPEHFCYCFSSNLCVLNATNTN